VGKGSLDSTSTATGGTAVGVVGATVAPKTTIAPVTTTTVVTKVAPVTTISPTTNSGDVKTGDQAVTVGGNSYSSTYKAAANGNVLAGAGSIGLSNNIICQETTGGWTFGFSGGTVGATAGAQVGTPLHSATDYNNCLDKVYGHDDKRDHFDAKVNFGIQLLQARGNAPQARQCIEEFVSMEAIEPDEVKGYVSNQEDKAVGAAAMLRDMCFTDVPATTSAQSSEETLEEGTKAAGDTSKAKHKHDDDGPVPESRNDARRYNIKSMSIAYG